MLNTATYQLQQDLRPRAGCIFTLQCPVKLSPAPQLECKEYRPPATLKIASQKVTFPIEDLRSCSQSVSLFTKQTPASSDVLSKQTKSKEKKKPWGNPTSTYSGCEAREGCYPRPLQCAWPSPPARTRPGTCRSSRSTLTPSVGGIRATCSCAASGCRRGLWLSRTRLW